MIRRFVAKLDDEFAKVIFHDVEAGVYKRVVEMNFLGGYRLGLDDGLRFFVADNLQNDFARLRRRAGPMNFRSARLDFYDELDNVFVEVVDGFPFRFGGELARGFPALKGCLPFVAGDLVIAQRRADDLAMAQIARHHARGGFELGNRNSFPILNFWRISSQDVLAYHASALLIFDK